MPRTVLNKEDKVKPEKKDKGEHLSAKSSASRALKRKKSKRYFSSSSGDSESDSSSSDSSSRSSGSSASSSSFSSSDVERKKKKKRQRQKSKIKSKSVAKQSRKASASRTPALSMPLPVPAPSAELAASPKQPTFEIWSPVDGEKQQKQRKSSSHRHHGHKSSSRSSQDNKHRRNSLVDGEKQQQQGKSSSHRHHENKSSRRSSQENKHRIISHAVSSCKSLTDADGSDQPAKEQEKQSNPKDQEQAVKVVKLDEVKLKSEVFKERAMNMMERSSAAQGTENPRDKDRKGNRDRYRDRERDRERSSTSSRSMSQRSHRGRSRYRRSPFSNNARNNYHPNEQQLRKVRLYIKGLSPQVTKAHIVEIFGSFGPLTNVDFPIENYGQGFNRKTGRGYAFCEFQNPRDCARARRHMNGGKIDGKQILVVPFQARKLNLSLRRRRPSPYTNYRY